MGEHTGISWCDHTFNPWIGCTKVSAGCTNCYAERDNKRYSWVSGWGPDGERRKTSASNWRKPLAWDAVAKRDGVRRKVFCASLADVFEDKLGLTPWRFDLWNLIIDTPNLDWLILTKRPENVIPESFLPTWLSRIWRNIGLPENVWLGVTAENQGMADLRIPLLLEISAKVRFVSVEPMLEQVDLTPWLNLTKYRHGQDGVPFLARADFLGKPLLDWVICGGESGPNARPMDLSWVRSLHNQCQISNVPFFFKQIGGNKKINGHWGGDYFMGKTFHEFPKG